MRKIFSKIFNKSNKSEPLTASDRLYRALNNKDFMNNVGRATDILYEYDKRR